MTYIPGIKNHRISADNSTTSLLGAGASFTGVWEDVTNYTSVAVAILGSVATDGVLYFDLSTDGGSTFASIPNNVSDVTFDLPKILNVVESHVRIRYVNGATPQTGIFSIQTKYSNGQELGLLGSVDSNVTNDTPTQLMKSVIVGEELDGNLNQTGIYKNVSLLQNDALKVGIPPTSLFQASRPTDPTIPSGASITIHPTLNTEPNVIDSGWIATASYGAGSLINIISDTALDAYLMNSSDDLGNNIQGDQSPTLAAAAGIAATIGAPFFDNYFRVVVVNTSGVSATEYSVKATGNQTAVSPVFSSLEQNVFGFFPAPLSRSVQMGRDPNNNYVNSRSGGYVDAATTQTPLGIGGVFNSGCIYVNGYSQLSLELLSDVTGVLTGTWYTDEACTNATRTLTIPYSTENEFIPISSPTFGNYLEVTYTNGSVAQSNFHMAIKFQNNAISGFVLGLDTPIAPNAVANLQRVVNSADLDRNRDKIIGQGSHRKFGYNETVGGSSEVIWAGAYIDGILNYTFPQAAETVRVKAGGNANDTSAGTGARTILISGLDENWDEVVESVTLNGTSASAATTATFFRINSAETLTVGSYGGDNAGNIVIENTSSLDELAYIPSGLGNTQQAIYTVPADKTAFITKIKISVGQGNSADIRLFRIDNVDILAAPFGPKHFEWGVEDYSGADVFELSTYLQVNEKNDIFADSQRITGGGNARVSLDFEYILVNN